MKPIYVETTINCPMPELWQLSQDPACHEQWDLRFTRITYLPARASQDHRKFGELAMIKSSAAANERGPARFGYATRVLPGLTIHGMGVTVGERVRPDGTCTSALRFRSEHPLSMIRSGSGYWRYVPTGAGIRFLTGYDYRPGFAVGDFVFRPLIGWATAWSFDRLRLWAERGITPRRSLVNALLELAWRVLLVLLASMASPWLAALTAAAVTIIPPSRTTPAARRCLRRPPDRLARTAPSTLDTLETL